MPDWKSVLRTVFVSRALDALEETRLVPERKVLYQFCARGHDVTQVLLGQRLTGSRDAVSPYYRSRPLALDPRPLGRGGARLDDDARRRHVGRPGRRGRHQPAES